MAIEHDIWKGLREITNSTHPKLYAPYHQPLTADAIGPLAGSFEDGPNVATLEPHKEKVRHHASPNPAFLPDPDNACFVFRHVCYAPIHA